MKKLIQIETKIASLVERLGVDRDADEAGDGGQAVGRRGLENIKGLCARIEL